MTTLRLLSVAPGPLPAWERNRLALLRNIDVRVAAPGAWRSAPHPDVIHLRAEPHAPLCTDVARFCRRHGAVGFVLETDLGSALAPAGSGWRDRRRARRTLAAVHSLIVRSPAGIGAARRLGFDGMAFVAPRPRLDATAAERAGLRRMLHLAPSRFVLGWAGPLDRRSGIFDMLEALALAKGAVLVAPGAGPDRQETLDRADALDVLPQLRLLTPDPNGGAFDSCPALPDCADAVIVPARPDAASVVELALLHGRPVIHDGSPALAAIAGSAGWAAPVQDPVRLAALIERLMVDPAHHGAAQAALRLPQAAEAAAAELAVAVLTARRGIAPPRPALRLPLSWAALRRSSPT